MKHLCLLFAFFLFLSPGVCAAESGTTPLVNYEVWEIPWDIPMEEFIQIAKKNTGIVFEPAANSDGVIDRCVAKSGQDITMLGLPVVEIRAYFSNETATYSGIAIEFSSPSENVMPEEIPSLYLKLREQMVQNYGEPTSEFVFIMHDGYHAFDFPWKDNVFHLPEFIQMVNDFLYVWLHTYFSNVLLFDPIYNNAQYGTYSHRLSIYASRVPEEPIISIMETPMLGNYTEYRKAHPLTNTPPPISVGF